MYGTSCLRTFTIDWLIHITMRKERKMKKTLLIVVSILMVAYFCASCATPEAPAASETPAAVAESSAATETPASEAPASAAPAAPESEAPASESPAAAATGDIKLGFSFGQSVHPFFVAMEQGARAAAKEAGVELVVTTADYDLETQVADVENLIQQGVNAIMINPIDSAAVANVCNEALGKNIGIFPVDINVDNTDVTAFVASDNVEIGRMLGEYVVDHLKGEGEVAFIGDPSITSLRDRETGFLEVIEANEGIKLVANQAAAIERTTALDAAETILQENPNIKVFAGCNESSAMGMLSAAQGAGKSDILVTGVDATDDILAAIKAGTQLSIAVAQDPYQMGYLAVQNAIKWINGEQIDEFISVPIGYINAENVDEYIAREAAYKQD